MSTVKIEMSIEMAQRLAGMLERTKWTYWLDAWAAEDFRKALRRELQPEINTAIDRICDEIDKNDRRYASTVPIIAEGALPRGRFLERILGAWN